METIRLPFLGFIWRKIMGHRAPLKITTEQRAEFEKVLAALPKNSPKGSAEYKARHDLDQAIHHGHSLHRLLAATVDASDFLMGSKDSGTQNLGRRASELAAEVLLENPHAGSSRARELAGAIVAEEVDREVTVATDKLPDHKPIPPGTAMGPLKPITMETLPPLPTTAAQGATPPDAAPQGQPVHDINGGVDLTRPSIKVGNDLVYTDGRVGAPPPPIAVQTLNDLKTPAAATAPTATSLPIPAGPSRSGVPGAAALKCAWSNLPKNATEAQQTTAIFNHLESRCAADGSALAPGTLNRGLKLNPQ